MQSLHSIRRDSEVWLNATLGVPDLHGMLRDPTPPGLVWSGPQVTVSEARAVSSLLRTLHAPPAFLEYLPPERTEAREDLFMQKIARLDLSSKYRECMHFHGMAGVCNVRLPTTSPALPGLS